MFDKEIKYKPKADNWIEKKKKIQKKIDTLVQGGLSRKEAIEYYKEKHPEVFFSPNKRGGKIKSKYSKGGGVRSAKYKV